MNANEFKKFKDEILRGFQLTTKPTIKSVSALIFSGLISTFGIYSILLSVGITGTTMYKAIGIFVLILVVADTFKRGGLVKYLNSLIRKVITGTGKVLRMQLVVSLLALSFAGVFDIVGSFSTANFVESSYQEYQATSSKEFSLLEANAKNGQNSLNIYSQELTVWQSDKKEGYQACMEQWKTWKAKCKKEWDNNNPKPINPNAKTSVSIDDYKSVKDDANSDFLSEYIFYIILFLSMALTILLQYTTISEITDNKDEIDQSLTSMVIGILQDRLTELESNMVQHETERNKLISSADKKEKSLGRDFEERGKAIALMGIEKSVEARGETVKRIANNTYVNEKSKAGFVVNPFNGDKKDEPLNGAVITDSPKNNPIQEGNNQPLNESVKRSRYNGEKESDPLNGAVITDKVQSIDFSLFTPQEQELINILWANGAVKRNQALTPRDTVLETIGNNKSNTLALRDLYKRLLGLDYISKKIGYFAEVELDQGLHPVNYDFDLGEF